MADTIRRALNGAIKLVLLGLMPMMAQAAPPSAGNILQQTQSPPAPLTAPSALLKLPQPEQQAGQSGIKIAVRRILIEGNSLIKTSTLTPLVDKLQGHTVTLGDLRAAAEAITRLYRARGYALAYAYIPAQSITHGAVLIAVVEPHYDRIAIDGHSRLKSAEAQRTLGIAAGAPIERAPLERGLLLLNQTPGIRVAGTLVPGTTPGTSRLEATLTDTPLARASVSTDNYGSTATGRSRGRVDVEIDNPAGYGSQVSFNGLTTAGGLLHAVGFTLRSPDLHQGLRASVYGSTTHYRLGGSFSGLGETGRASQLGVGVAWPVIIAPGRLVNARLDLLGNRFTQQSGSVGLDDRSHINLTRLTVNGALGEAGGGMTSGGVSLSCGDLRLDSADARTADAGPHAAGHFWVTRFQVAQEQPLPHGLHLDAALSAQLASHNLNDSEKFYLGGYDGVMSYATGDAGGDTGALLSLRLGHRVPLRQWPGRLDAALLAQYGTVSRNHSPYMGASEPNRMHLAAVGLGLSYRWSTRLNVQLDYARRLGGAPATLAWTRNDELWASLQLDF